MIIESGLGRPAYVHCAPHMGASPLKDVLHLVPIGDVLKVERLDRSTSNNHSIVLFFPHLFEIAIKHHHVFYRRILWRMAAEFHEADFQLQWCIGK